MQSNHFRLNAWEHHSKLQNSKRCRYSDTSKTPEGVKRPLEYTERRIERASSQNKVRHGCRYRSHTHTETDEEAVGDRRRRRDGDCSVRHTESPAITTSRHSKKVSVIHNPHVFFRKHCMVVLRVHT